MQNDVCQTSAKCRKWLVTVQDGTKSDWENLIAGLTPLYSNAQIEKAPTTEKIHL